MQLTCTLNVNTTISMNESTLIITRVVGKENSSSSAMSWQTSKRWPSLLQLFLLFWISEPFPASQVTFCSKKTLSQLLPSRCSDVASTLRLQLMLVGDSFRYLRQTMEISQIQCLAGLPSMKCLSLTVFYNIWVTNSGSRGHFGVLNNVPFTDLSNAI